MHNIHEKRKDIKNSNLKVIFFMALLVVKNLNLCKMMLILSVNRFDSLI